MAENLDAFLAHFGVPCLADSVPFLGLLDQPDELQQLSRVGVHSRQYELTYRSDAVALARDQAIAQALAQQVPLVAGRVYRDRADAFTREESPALLVECIDEDTQPLGGPAGPWRPVGQMDRNDLRVALTVVVRDPQWQQVADAVRVQVHSAVMRLAGPLALSPGIAGVSRQRCEWARLVRTCPSATRRRPMRSATTAAPTTSKSRRPPDPNSSRKGTLPCTSSAPASCGARP